jgi:UDP-glucose 4-epimerase
VPTSAGRGGGRRRLAAMTLRRFGRTSPAYTPDMAPRRVLVTGASRHLGARLVRSLLADPGVDAVVAVDTAAPTGDLAGVPFVRADPRHPLLARAIATQRIDTVVHLLVVPGPLAAGGRAAMKDLNVIGTMQLLAAVQTSPAVRRLVVKSTAAVYGASPRDPALFTENTPRRGVPRTGYSRDAVEIEGYVRGFGRRRPDVSITLLRFSNLIGPGVDSPLTRFLGLPVVPTVLGFDPRMQFCHEDDALEVLRLATLSDRPGTFNVAGTGVLLLSQVLRRLARPGVPVPAAAVSVGGRLLRRLGLADFSPEQMRFLEHGRIVDTTALREVFGYTPHFSTAQALANADTRGSGAERGAGSPPLTLLATGDSAGG